ncbi:MAG: tRNA pseudouridine(38-40) synthase TruA [Bdellovibrionota bacterium]
MEKEKRLKRPTAKVARAAATTLKSFRLVVAYKGTNYSGWQKQAKEGGRKTVQEMIEKAARKVLRRAKVNIHASGRTDAGVHARAQVCHLRVAADLPAAVLIKALNAHLPEDIRILRLEECAEDFHSQLDVTAKTYRYFILNTQTGKDPVHWPFLRPYTWFITYRLDYDAMRAALKRLEGSHDFKSFQNKGTPVPNTVREILEARLIEHTGAPDEIPPWMPGADFQARLLEIRVTGTGFLKQMVRNIVGTVVEVGRGRIKPEAVSSILEDKDRASSGMTAPPYGLFLDRVDY